MNDDLLKRLEDAREACRIVRQIADRSDFDEFELELIVQLALERLLGIVGESLNEAEKLDSSIAQSIPQLRSIIGMRHRLVHEYDTVRGAIVKDVARNRIVQLEGQLEVLIDSIETAG